MNKCTKNKRCIVFFSILLLVASLTSCYGCDTKYKPNAYVEEEKWKCQEIDMYFYMAEPYPYGELDTDGKSIRFFAKTSILNQEIIVYEDAEEIENKNEKCDDYRLFTLSDCRFQNGRFTAKLSQDRYGLFNGGQHKLTFIREDY